MDGEDIGLAFLGIFALGGGYLAINELNRRKLGEKIEKIEEGHTHDIENLLHKNGYSERNVSALEESHSHPSLESRVRTDMDAHLGTENLTDEDPVQVRYAAMWEQRNQDPFGRLVVGHPKGVWDWRLRSQRKSEGIVPAYRVGTRTVLPAMGPGNSESDYFYDRIVGGRVISPDYDFPRYYLFSNNPGEVDLVEDSTHRGSWITMVDLVRALEALNGKVEEYRNAIYNDMREYGHSHNYNNAEVMQ